MKKYSVPGIRKGLTDAEAERSQRENGRNVFSNRKPKSFLKCFLENLGDPVIKILLVALAVNLFLVFRGNDIVETIGIGISVLLSTLISTLSERGSEAAFRRLDAECSHAYFRVYRNGSLKSLSIDDLAVGDLLKVSAGEQIPADAFVTSGEITVDQSMLTGESREIKKLHSMDKTKTPSSKSAVFRGSAILSGEAEIEIFAVGEQSFLGKISDEVKLDTRESPLKVRLTKLAKQISVLGYIAAFLVALAYLFNVFVIDSGFERLIILQKIKDFHYLFEHLLHAFMLGLTVIVMAVPEGLPMMIAVVLSSNIKKMIKDNVLVRKPVGIEAAGSMNILFTDKTGTVTEGKMSVGEIISSDCSTYKSFTELKKDSPKSAELYLLNAYFNTASSFSDKGVLGGNSTEKALADSILNSMSKRELQGYTVLERLPFDSAQKFSAVSVVGKEKCVLIKGAPERLLPYCRYAYARDGRRISFSAVSKELLLLTSRLTSEGKRLIWIAESSAMPRTKQGELTFICAVVLLDKIRTEAKESTEDLRQAGVGVVMITGDNKETAEHIAKECGIINSQRSLVLDS
ncbi:MAG: cation-transporting P-type ATPase, partial [Clostridia bacterium]|nr:cation-transporting P-type ATPase [Clostridia bacterium]